MRRQLSAIMFTDLAGYTAMMQEDEFNAKGIRDLHRQILESEIKNHDGEILQYYGDGALSIFNSTISAANSALSIQRSSIQNKIPLRVGIHTGDVVVEKEGVYGDGVNIASRIESFSVPGSVMISDKVFDDIKNHQTFQPVLMGEFELKNVKKPVEVYALTNEGLVVPQRTDLKGKVKERIKSIAVLPFVNRSSDPENEYFSDGISEEIITALAKVEGLRVISRTSSFSFKGKNVDARTIGKQLEVQSILDGSVRKSGNKVRIVAQLSSTFDGYQLWTETYDRTLEDIFEVQDEISLKIAQQLKERLSKKGLEDHDKTKAINIEAYNAYLQGLFFYNKWTPANAEKAVDSFKKAIELEPTYAQAYAGLALAYSLMSFTGFIDPPTGYQLTEEAARKTISLDPDIENGYIALGFVEFFNNWDFEKGRECLEKALEINPKSPEANQAKSFYYLITSDLDKSLEAIQKAREVDPLSLLTNRTLADVYYLRGDYKMAIEVYDWLLEQDPEFKSALDFKAWAYLMDGQFDVAIEIFESFLDGEIAHSMKPFVQLGYAHALRGEKEIAESYLQQLMEDAKEQPGEVNDLNFATLYTGLGDHEKALDYLEKVVDQRIGAVLLIHISPIWKPLREKERFSLLLDKIGLHKNYFNL
ncbi:adenylate/guanylate cyclase domain-containing protein [Ekhidna sp.]|uniref:adenylate/guanylate cyclase domain-containing protein n=1 Tax=Ekhidna sp. TaxID=2608089 RepID=UPI003BAC6E82